MYKPLFQENLVSSINTIQTAGSNLKIALFKKLLKNDIPPDYLQDEYLRTVEVFIKGWRDVAEDLQEAIKSTKGSEKVNAIKYNSVKQYLFTTYDYASILPFIDGVFRGINKYEFNRPKDIDEFRKYTVSKAFKDRNDTVGGLVEEVLSLSSGGYDISPATTADAKLFDSIKGTKLFHNNDSRDLYRSIEKSIKFVFYSEKDGRVNFPESPMMVTAVVNNIIEYATYSLTAYATRIYAIASYANPYIIYNTSYHEATVAYSTAPGVTHLMLDIDENNARDNRKINDFLGGLMKFITVACGYKDIKDDTINQYSANKYIDVWKSSIMDDSVNIFNSKLLGNPIRSRFANFLNGYYPYGSNVAIKYRELADELRNYIYNDRFYDSTTATPKDEIIGVISRSIPDKETIEEYQKFTVDLVKFFGGFLGSIRNLIDDYSDSERNLEPGFSSRTTILRDKSEILEMLNILYKDIALALFYRCRELEEQINLFHMKDKENSDIIFTLNLPGDKPRERVLSGYMSTSIPTTQRLPIELTDIYAMPYNDQLLMYSEYAKTKLPNDPYYFNEDGSENIIQKIWNAIVSFLKGIIKRVTDFADDAQFKKAVKWVQDRRDKLSGMTCTEAVEVKPYQQNIVLDIDKCYNHINTNFNLNNVNTEEGVKRFTTGLYPSPDVANRFTGNGDRKELHNSYILWKCFGDGYSMSSGKKSVTLVKLTNENDIRQHMAMWVETVSTALDAIKNVREGIQKIETAIEECQRKSSQWFTEAVIFEADAQTQTNTGNASTGDNGSMPSIDGKTTSGQSSPSSGTSTAQQNDQNKNDDGKSHVNDAIKAINVALTSIIMPSYEIMRMAIIDQYKYIQAVYYNNKKENGG